MATVPTVLVTNLKRDRIYFSPVYNTKDGKPTKNAQGKVVKPGPDVEAFELKLGSSDDDGVDGVPQPAVEVPRWAFDHLRRTTLFAKLVADKHVTATLPATL